MDALVLAPDLSSAAVARPDPPVGPRDTAALTFALREGDEDAWRRFHADYAPRLFRYLLVVCAGREDDARDALQATFLRAVKHVRPMSSEAELWNWLTVLARSAASDVSRRERRYLGRVLRWFHHQPPPPCDPDDASLQLHAALSAELPNLSPADRLLLERKYLSGDAVRDLANALGTSEKAIESRLTRARLKLKAAILARLQHERSP